MNYGSLGIVQLRDIPRVSFMLIGSAQLIRNRASSEIELSSSLLTHSRLSNIDIWVSKRSAGKFYDTGVVEKAPTYECGPCDQPMGYK